MANTEPLGIQNTEDLAGGNNQNLAQILTSPVTFEDNGEVYEVSTDLLEIGGESQVYFATAKTTGEKYVAKLHTSQLVFSPSYQENRNRVLSFLQKHTDYSEFHIMPLKASGFIEISTDDKILEYPIDILPYCEDRDFKKGKRKFDYKELRSRVIPSLLRAINTIHSNGFIHRDIKPANIFELNGEIVLSDFGTAVTIGSGTDDIHHTLLGRGTIGYSAPEISRKYARIESDYFSFGCTLATLYNGKHPYDATINEGMEYVFHSSIDEKGLLIDYSKGDEPLMNLIDSLVRVRFSDRIGFEGVSLWLADEKALYEGDSAPNSGRSNGENREWEDPLIYGGTRYWNAKDFAAAMVLNWDQAKTFFFRRYPDLMRFFAKNMTLQDNIEMVAKETSDNADLGLARFIQHLLEGGSLYWRGEKFESLHDISSYLLLADVEKKDKSIYSARRKNIIEMLQSGYISWKMEDDLTLPTTSDDVKKSITNSLPGIKEIEKVSKIYPYFTSIFSTFSWYMGDGEIVKNKTVDSCIDFDVAGFYTSLDLINTQDGKMKSVDQTWATIAHLGYFPEVVATRKQLDKANDFREKIELFYVFLENVCENKSAVRWHYCRYSPNSYILWVQQNISLYEFHSPDAQWLKQLILNMRFSDNMTINENKENFRKLSGFFSEGGDFHKLFQGDIIAAALGLKHGKDRHGEITADHADAFFLDTFYGYKVPYGFKKSIGLPEELGRK